MPADTAKRPPTSDHLPSKKKRNIRKVWIALDSEVAEAVAEAQSKVINLELRIRTGLKSDKVLDQLNKELEEAKAAASKAEEEFRKPENSIHWTLQSLGRSKYDQLVTEYPPTPEQQAEAEAGLREEAKAKGQDPDQVIIQKLPWDVDEFPIALIAACTIHPKMEEKELLEWLRSDDWIEDEILTIFYAALEANTQRRTVQLGNA